MQEWLQLARELDDALNGPPVCDSTAAALQVARSPESDSAWTGLVERALGDIAGGQIEKVVLARSVRVDCGQPLSAPALLATLERLGFKNFRRTMLPGVGHSNCAAQVWKFGDEVTK